MRLAYIRKLGTTLLCALALTACTAGKETDQMVASFHDQYNAGNFDHLTSTWGSAEQRDQLRNWYANAQPLLGRFKQASRIDWSEHYSPKGHLVAVKYRAEFERGSGLEEFEFVMKDEEPIMIGFTFHVED